MSDKRKDMDPAMPTCQSAQCNGRRASSGAYDNAFANDNRDNNDGNDDYVRYWKWKNAKAAARPWLSSWLSFRAGLLLI